jgi:spore maturation protein CgeB
LRDHFTPGVDAVVFSRIEECAKHIEYFVTHEKERREIAMRAQQKVFSEHLLEHRLKRVVERLSEARSSYAPLGRGAAHALL